MPNFLSPLFNLFFPELCRACAEALQPQEFLICTSCRHELPVTGLHHTTQKPIQELLYGRIEIQQATALFYFEKKGKVQQLIHNLKYRGQEEISVFLGKWLGADINGLPRFQDMDCVVPVPLHKSRLKSRGYNQVSGFGRALAEKLNIPFENGVLFRNKKTRTQVFLSRILRGSEVINSFEVKDFDSLRGKHILIVDDLITTGGTIEGCVLALQKIPNIKVSVAVMAIAR